MGMNGGLPGNIITNIIHRSNYHLTFIVTSTKLGTNRIILVFNYEPIIKDWIRDQPNASIKEVSTCYQP